jgi:hypothetical protein
LTSYLANQLPSGKKSATVEGYRTLVRRMRAELPPDSLMIANMIRARFPDGGLKELGPFDGSYLEGFTEPVGDVREVDYIARVIEATQQAARDGKIIAMTLGLGVAASDEDRIDDTRAKLDSLDGLNKRIDYLAWSTTRPGDAEWLCLLP